MEVICTVMTRGRAGKVPSAPQRELAPFASLLERWATLGNSL